MRLKWLMVEKEIPVAVAAVTYMQSQLCGRWTDRYLRNTAASSSCYEVESEVAASVYVVPNRATEDDK